MKQVLQNLNDGKTRVVEVPAPVARNNMALIQTAASLVSAGTERTLVEFAEKNLVGKARSRPDLVRQVLDKARREGLVPTIQAAFNRLDQPMPLGYSSAGVIIEAGEGLTGFKVGDRVACAGGNFAVHAEYAVVPQNLLAHVPDHVNLEHAAFATLGSIAMHGFRLATPQLGESVAVIGMGLLGLLAASIARAAGCKVFGIDISPSRVALARQMGFTCSTRDEAVQSASTFTGGLGFDVVLVCADSRSNDPIELAGAIARDRARVIAVGAFGLNIPRKVYFEKELHFQVSRSYGPGRYDPAYEEKGRDYPAGYVRWTEGRNLQAFVDLLASGAVDVAPLISHRFDIDQAPDAYELITGKTKRPFLGVLLTYPAQPSTAQPNRKVAVGVESGSFSGTQPVVGVLGAGNYANATFLPAMKKAGGAVLAGVASASGLTARHAAQRFGFQYAASEEARLLEDDKINTLVLLTRHNLHARQVLAGLAAGKHIFCEKPLALTDEELEQVEQAMHNPGSPLLMVGYNRRFAPLTVALKHFLKPNSEQMHVYYRVNAGFIPVNHWVHDPAQGGGRIIGEGCHFIDLLTHLIGQLPCSVTAVGLPDGGRYHQDNVQITLTYPDGSIGVVAYLANGDKSVPKERIEVFAGGHVAILDDFRSLETTVDGRRSVQKLQWKQDKGHQAGWSAFVQAISSGSQPPIPYEELFAVSRATFAAVRSMENHTEIRLA